MPWVPLVAFVLVGALLCALEGKFPALPQQPRRREGLRTDLAYWVFTPLVTRVVRKGALLVAVVALALVTGTKLEPGAGLEPFHAGSWVTSRPLWQQIVMLVVLADLLGYWIHRLFHRGRLWPFHAIHHSSTQLDWLSSVRVHPINDALGGTLRAVPLLLLGFDPLAVAGLVPLLGLHGLLLHANVTWSFGPLRYVISSPCFHRWHHAQLGALPQRFHRVGGVNFAGLLPIFDILFGTFHMVEQPRAFGVREAVPARLGAQLWWPFRSGESRRADG